MMGQGVQRRRGIFDKGLLKANTQCLEALSP